MKFLLLTLLSASAFAQLEKPLLEGKCASKDGKATVQIINNEVKAVISQKRMKKSCTFFIADAATQEGQMRTKEIFYLVPSACDGRANGAEGFNQANISDLAFFEVSSDGKFGDGNFSAFKDSEALPCSYKVSDWAKIRKLSREKRKLK
ncbi:MAG: hypothetical protein V4598_01675 [Bdellovibrionota bacterium]